MDFTELYKHSNALVVFSPGAHFILNAVQDRLVVRRADSFQITRTWLVDSTPSPTYAQLNKTRDDHKPSAGTGPPPADWITHVGWACDSEYILAACAKKGVVQVFKMRDEQWNARIDAGAEGLVKAEWAPDGRHILCFSEWGLRVSVWSLVTGAATYIQYPVHPDRGYSFRRDGHYFVLAERHKSKDTIGVYDATDAYKLVRHFPSPTSALASLSISPTGNYLAVWENSLEYKLSILTLPGVHVSTFSPTPDPGLGIRCVAWHPSGSFILVGGWDDKIHILDSASWSPVSTLELSSKIPSSAAVWREPRDWIEATHGRGFLTYERSQASTQAISVSKPDFSKPHPKNGTLRLEWNNAGTLFFAQFESALNVLLIYSFPTASEPFQPKLRSVLVQTAPILHARWNPVRRSSLALCCGTGGVFLWSNEWVSEGSNKEEEVAECVGVPAKKFQLKDFRWAPDGKGLLLLDKDTFCGSFEVTDENEVVSS